MRSTVRPKPANRSRCKRRFERGAGVLAHGLTVGEKYELDRQVEQRPQLVADIRGRDSFGEPRVLADSDAAAGRSEQDVTRCKSAL